MSSETQKSPLNSSQKTNT